VSDSGTNSATAWAAQAYLCLLPVGHLFLLPTGGAAATGADAAALVLLSVWVVELVARPSARERLRVGRGGAPTPGRGTGMHTAGLLVLLALGLWVGLSGAWGYHRGYAAAKGAGMVSLALVALALSSGGLAWRGATRAWLAGTALALALTALVVVAGPAGASELVLHSGGGVQGLPFERVSGPFLHPSMMGDYLVVSGILLWGLWPELRGSERTWAGLLGGAVVVSALLTASTALVGGGLFLVWVGRSVRGGLDSSRGWVLRVAGGAVAAVSLAFVLFPLRVDSMGLDLVNGAIRPRIWASSVDAFVASPILGVGAAPYLASAGDPLNGGAEALWDAHNAYLSVLGQFGLVGAVIAGCGLWMVVKGTLPWRPHRRRLAAGMALAAVAVDALFMASEDLRHAWALIGMLGLATRDSGAEG
jgi:O-antigen ligase